jgi:hypothetical protein
MDFYRSRRKMSIKKERGCSTNKPSFHQTFSTFYTPIAISTLYTETQFDIMSLDDFQSYVERRGVDFDGLTDDKKGEWRETFDKSRGNYISFSYFHTSALLSINICACQFYIDALKLFIFISWLTPHLSLSLFTLKSLYIFIILEEVLGGKAQQ